jgi:hypothetical protein
METPSTMTSVELADRVAGLVAQAKAYLVGRPMASAMPLIIGETGECVRGGCEGPPENATASLEVGAGGGPIHPSYSEGFVDGFLYLDKLGLAAALNVSAIMKEKLFGSNDGLVNPLLYPQPPYWVSLVHKQLLGPRVLADSMPMRTLLTGIIVSHPHWHFERPDLARSTTGFGNPASRATWIP